MLVYLFLFIQLIRLFQVRRERERKKIICHLVIWFANVHSILDWARVLLETKDAIWVSPVGGRDQTTGAIISSQLELG